MRVGAAHRRSDNATINYFPAGRGILPVEGAPLPSLFSTNGSERSVETFLRTARTALCQHVSVKIPAPHRGVDVAKCPLVFCLPRRRDEPGHCSAIKGAGEAQAADAGRLEVRDGERLA